MSSDTSRQGKLFLTLELACLLVPPYFSIWACPRVKDAPDWPKTVVYWYFISSQPLSGSLGWGGKAELERNPATSSCKSACWELSTSLQNSQLGSTLFWRETSPQLHQGGMLEDTKQQQRNNQVVPLSTWQGSAQSDTRGTAYPERHSSESKKLLKQKPMRQITAHARVLKI